METVLVHLTRMMRRMKMSAVCTITLLLLSCSAFTTTDAEKCDYSLALGGSEVLRSFPWESHLRLRWMHDSTIVFDSSIKKDRKYNIDGNGSLMLKNVKKDNGGKYLSEVLDNGKLKGKRLSKVCIIDRIPKPEVKFECFSSSVMFNCTMSEQIDGVTYQWSEGDKILQDEVNGTLVRRFNQLSGNSFSCKVSISILSQTSKAVAQTCSKLDKKTLFGLDFWLMVGTLAGGGGLVLVLIIATIICCTKASRKKRMQREEERELRLEWSNTQQQQHAHHVHPHNQHHHHHRQPRQQQQQTAGHTGPRQQRSKQPRPLEHSNEHPQPSPRRLAQTPRPVIGVAEEKPPPLPQPRKKTPKM